LDFVQKKKFVNYLLDYRADRGAWDNFLSWIPCHKATTTTRTNTTIPRPIDVA